RDIPALDDFLQEAVAEEALPVRARQVARADRPRPIRRLEFPQDFEGPREFFRQSGHGRLPLEFVSPLSDCVVPYLYYCAVPCLSYCVERRLVPPAWKCDPAPRRRIINLQIGAPYRCAISIR